MACSAHEHELKAPLSVDNESLDVSATYERLDCFPHLHLRNGQLVVQSVRVRKHQQLGLWVRQEDSAQPAVQACQSRRSCAHGAAHAPEPSIPKRHRNLQRRAPNTPAAAICRRHELRGECRARRSPRPRARILEIGESERPRGQQRQHGGGSLERGAFHNVKDSHAAKRGQARQLGGDARYNCSAHAVPDEHKRRRCVGQRGRSCGVARSAACKQLVRHCKHVGHQPLRARRRSVSKALRKVERYGERAPLS